MEWLKQDELVLIKNNNIKFANKKRSIPVFGSLLLYKLENLMSVVLPTNYSIDFKNYKVKAVTLETLRDIISIVEKVRGKGLKKPIIFLFE